MFEVGASSVAVGRYACLRGGKWPVCVVGAVGGVRFTAAPRRRANVAAMNVVSPAIANSKSKHQSTTWVLRVLSANSPRVGQQWFAAVTQWPATMGQQSTIDM